ncbi:hypothetical protein, partial [Nitrospira sp. BLG_2]|uniref:hypothetical protein n=1 Tax=Nitrospira sp. BLG_2 TaxID=3397507 RepID=UPI003B9F81DF
MKNHHTTNLTPALAVAGLLSGGTAFGQSLGGGLAPGNANIVHTIDVARPIDHTATPPSRPRVSEIQTYQGQSPASSAPLGPTISPADLTHPRVED